MADNRRKTHENAVYRMKDFIDSRKFLESDLATLNQKKEMLETSYANFIEEHLLYVRFISKDQFQQEDKHLEMVESIYQELCIDLRRQIKQLEEYDVIYRQNQIQTATNETKSESSKKKCDIGKKEEEEGEIEPMEADSSSEGTIHEKAVESVVVVQHNTQTGRQHGIDLRERLNERHRRRSSIECHNCSGPHRMFDCGRFLRLSILQRRMRVNQLNLCKNCFMKKQRTRIHRCQAGPCKCGKFHNALLCPRAMR